MFGLIVGFLVGYGMASEKGYEFVKGIIGLFKIHGG